MISAVLDGVKRSLRTPAKYDALTYGTIALMVLVAVQIGYTTRNYYFFSDDFLNFVLTREMGPTPAYFFRDWIGEFIPLFGVFHVIYLALFGVVFWPFRIILVLSQWALILLTAQFGRRRSIPLYVHIPALAIIACSPIYGTLFQWYSASLQVIFEAIAGLAAIYVMAHRGPLSATRYLGASLLYLVGMFCFPKGLFIAAILFAVRMYVASAEYEVTPKDAALRALRDVSLIIALGVGYAINVVVGHHSSGVPHPGIGLLVKYMWVGWNHGFISALLGSDQNVGHIALGNLFIVGLVIVSIARDRRASIVWAGYLIYFLVSLAVIADNRATVFGLESATEPRYYADMFDFFVAVVLIVFTPKPGAAAVRLAPGFAGLLFIVTGFCCFFWISASARIPYVWDRPLRNKVFIQNLKASLANAAPDAKIADGVVPSWLMPNVWWPHTQYRFFLLMFKHHHGVVVPLQAAQWRIDDDGKLVPISKN